MKNVQIQSKGTKLVVTIDLSVSHGASATGKSEIIATTSGNVTVPGADGVKLGINCYRPL